MADGKELDWLLAEPRETLDVEVKSWLDLGSNEHRSLLAKELIALANHGGGFVVVGFEELGDGSFKPAAPRPPDLKGWSQDTVQGVVAKYLDPGIQCVVQHRQSLVDGHVYPIIVVPGGHRVPIRAKAGSPDGQKLVTHRIYIRRPGPTSDEPKTADEWDRFLERCLRNRQADLLDAMRSIMAGVVPGSGHSTPTRVDQLLEFEKQAVERWAARVASLPDTTPAKLVHGSYDAAFAIDGSFKSVNLGQLSSVVETEVQSHSGWPPFLTINRAPFRPKPVEGAVECWIGPDKDGPFQTPSHHDFWRVSPEGLMFTKRGYQEDDGHYDLTPGTSFDIVSPVWRLGEAVMEAVYIARALDAIDAKLVCRVRYAKLSGRTLVSYGNQRRTVISTHTAVQDGYEATETVELSALPDALPELVFGLLTPLYELFDFYKLSKRLVEEELISLLRRRF